METAPRLTKTEWPVYITNALEIPTVNGRGGPWISNGDTTDMSWFRAMCRHLAVDYPGERIRAMRAIVEAAGGTWDQALHSSAVPGKRAGGNVRREAFEELWRALLVRGLSRAGRSAAPMPDAESVVEADGGPLPDMERAYRHILLRRGQPEFRARLLAAYQGRCAVTGADVVETLEAAHIVAHSSGGGMDASNGLLLRADIHTLFDRGLIAIETKTWTIDVHRTIRETTFGAELHGKAVRLPEKPRQRPSVAGLDQHRMAASS